MGRGSAHRQVALPGVGALWTWRSLNQRHAGRLGGGDVKRHCAAATGA